MSVEIDPEVRQLLDQVIADPSSTLTRIPERGFGSWLQRREPISAGEPMLSRAEKHLVRAHREEVALLLYQACQRMLLEDPAFGSHFCRRQRSDLEVKVPDADDWRRRANQELGLVSDSGSPELLLLEELKQGSTKSPDASRIAAASLSMSPRDEARIWLGLALYHEGKLGAARQGYMEVLRGQPAPLNRALSLLNLGSAELKRGDPGAAWENYRGASEVPADLALALVFLINSSILLGKTRDALEASRRLQQSVPAGHPLLSECARVITESARCLPEEARPYRRTLATLLTQLSPAAREVFEGVAQ